jgi:hypothetical protein
MRHAFFIAAFAASSIAFAADPKARTPVLVELFTSEGCSSCPPADALLARLQHDQPVEGAEIVVLGEHVDYWDGLGWRDRFSSQQYTARQNGYGERFHLGSVYTPQMVVDGTSQFVGNDQSQATHAISAASRTPKLPLTISTPKIAGRIVSASVSSPLSTRSDDPRSEVFAALVDPKDTTDVPRGENSGRRLNHVAVVRTLARIGTLADLARGSLAFTLDAPGMADPATMQVVVFAQQPGFGRVFGVAMSGLDPARASHARNLSANILGTIPVREASLAHLE